MQASIFTGVRESESPCFTYRLLPLGRSPCDSLVLKDDASSVKVANFNTPSMCVYAAILNRLRSVTSGHTNFCQFENNRERGALRDFRI